MKSYEYGWSEDQFCAWRRLILGKKLRGSPEFSAQPIYDENADELTPVVCAFADGDKHEIAHVTMATRHTEQLVVSLYILYLYIDKLKYIYMRYLTLG